MKKIQFLVGADLAPDLTFDANSIRNVTMANIPPEYLQCFVVDDDSDYATALTSSEIAKISALEEAEEAARRADLAAAAAAAAYDGGVKKKGKKKRRTKRKRRKRRKTKRKRRKTKRKRRKTKRKR